MIESTDVIFRMWRVDGEDYLIALFPTIKADLNGHCLSYEHVGQHGAADYFMIIAHSRPASNVEYVDLAAELIGRGYNLRIQNRMNHKTYLSQT